MYVANMLVSFIPIIQPSRSHIGRVCLHSVADRSVTVINRRAKNQPTIPSVSQWALCSSVGVKRLQSLQRQRANQSGPGLSCWRRVSRRRRRSVRLAGLV